MSLGALRDEADLDRWLERKIRETPGLLRGEQVKGRIVCEDFIVPTFTGSWVSFNADNTVGYMKDRMGFVHLRGAAKSGTAGTSIFTLPVGYRPEQQEIIPIGYVTGGLGTDAEYVTIGTNGTVTPTSDATNVLVSLSGITFKAAS